MPRNPLIAFLLAACLAPAAGAAAQGGSGAPPRAQGDLPVAAPAPQVENTAWPLWVHRRTPEARERESLRLLGPFIEQEYTAPLTWGTVRPLWIAYEDARDDSTGFHLLYPFFNYKEAPGRVRWDLLQLVRYHRYHGPPGSPEETFFNLFPFVWYNQTGDPATAYKGLFPVAGKVRNFLFYEELNWAAFPLYFNWHRGGAARHFLPFPFVQWQSGRGAGGAALWPLAGHFHQTGRYDYQYLLWPLVYRRLDQFDKGPFPRLSEGVLPFYARVRSPNVTDWTFAWPFFGWRRERDPAYSENRYFWPFLVQGRGKKHVNRWMPFYTHEIIKGVDEHWYLWPLLHTRQWEREGLRIEQGELLFFLIWSQRQYSLANPGAPPARLTHVWPFASYWDNGAGRKQFQLFSPLEVFFPRNRVVRDLYTPLFALYRYSERDGGATIRQSFFWDLLAREERPGYKKTQLGALYSHVESAEAGHLSLLGGLLEVGHEKGEPRFELFWNELSPVNFLKATAPPRRGPKR